MTFRPRRDDRPALSKVDAEFQLHIDLTTEELVTNGWAPEQARREALRRFGRADRFRAECLAVERERNRWTRRAVRMEGVIQDVVYAVRGMRRSPGFAWTVIATLALGIGATTTVFSVLDTLVLRALPYPDAERLVIVGTTYDAGDRPRSVSPMNFFDWRDQNDVFGGMVASRLESKTVLRDGYPEMVLGAGVSTGFFEMLGANPMIGRPIGPRDDRPGGDRAVVLNHGLWQSYFGADADVVGRTVSLSGFPHTVVGIMPPSFHPPEALYHAGVDLWFPLAHVSDDLSARDNGFLQVMARLEPGVSIELARQSMTALQQRIYESLPAVSERVAEGRAAQQVAIAPMREHTVGGSGRVMWIFLGSVFLLLTISCANAANLFLARAADRGREIALRTALGARTGRIARQLLTEALALSLAAGAAGVLLAVAGLRAFVALAPRNLPRLSEVSLDGRVLVFTAAVSMLTGIVFGLAPALQHARTNARDALHTGAVTASAGRQRNRLRRGLVAFETALTVVLLVGAGLLINSFVRLTSSDPGFDPTDVARMELYIGDHYETNASQAAFFSELVQRAGALPGVEVAAATNNLPMTGNRSRSIVSLPEWGAEETKRVSVNSITPKFFATLGVPVLAGRDFTVADREGAEPVAIVNTSLARELWPAVDPVGQRFRFGRTDSEGAWITVVGVVATIHQRGLGQEDGPAVYLAQAQSPFVFGNLVVRAAGDMTTLLPLLRAELLRLDARVAAEEIGPLTDQMAVTIRQPRFRTVLLGSFAGLALILAAVGVYGTVSYVVGQRAHELGIRMALGAAAPQMFRMVMRQGLATVAVGLLVGGTAALTLSRTLSGFVYGISTTDWPTYAVVTMTMLGVTALACWLPARRATRVDPIETLRVE